MALVRTNITIPEEVLAMVDSLAGPRGRSAYIAEAVRKQARRDSAIRIVRETAGVLKGSKTWGDTPEEYDRILREVRDGWDRDDRLWPSEGEGESDAVRP